MSIRGFVRIIPFILMFPGLVGIVSLIFEGDYREVQRKPNSKQVSCKISEYHKSFIGGKFGFVVYTNTKDTLYITSGRVDVLKRSGVWSKIEDGAPITISYLEKYKKNSKYIKTIEEIRYKGKIYLGLKDVTVKEKITLEEKRERAIHYSLFLFSGILVYFLILKTRPLIVNRLPIRNAEKLSNPIFPIQKGDIRISKIKDYYVVDKKVNFELAEVAKVTGDSIVVSKFFKNNIIKLKNIKYLYLEFYTQRSLNKNTNEIVAEYSAYKSNGRLKKLFKVSEEMTENGIETYFKDSYFEVLNILCSVINKDYKLSGGNK